MKRDLRFKFFTFLKTKSNLKEHCIIIVLSCSMFAFSACSTTSESHSDPSTEQSSQDDIAYNASNTTEFDTSSNDDGTIIEGQTEKPAYPVDAEDVQADDIPPEQSDQNDSSENLYFDGYIKQEVEEFAKKIKDYVVNDDKTNLEEFINYPIKVIIEGNRTELYNSEEFLNNYDKIIHSSFKEAISEASVVDMFSNYQGVMISDGKIWFGHIDGKNGLWITAINND